uniref:Uncharacterized protein AlNc14C218G9052 n=1 Tax=Albugo laibachii Nc14 TaxID=890382 RepID=F0WRQ6_9STRA|nr:conserved hypothetical protein [Albugo laibachii Nc14]|eukprot:CCA24021.1 conserved hypothetical protein [Albugo laibachii Nc14]
MEMTQMHAHLDLAEIAIVPLFELRYCMHAISSSNLKSAVVIEVGSRYLKCGFSQEKEPRCIAEWKIAKYTPNPHQIGQLLKYVDSFLTSLFYDQLNIRPIQRHFVVCEDLLAPQMLREALMLTLLKTLQASSITFVPTLLTSLYATSYHTALIVDVGWYETRLLPIYKGSPLLHLYTTIPGGTQSSCLQLSTQLGIPRAKAEEILTKCCFCRPLIEPIEAVDAEFQDHLEVPGKLRWQVLEHYFTSEREHESIAEAVAEILSRAPIDLRKNLSRSILLIGGSSMLPGFENRLRHEICCVVNEYATLMHLSEEIEMAKLWFPRNVLGWIGGSIFAATHSRKHSITLDEYTAGRRLTDWLSVSSSYDSIQTA